MIHPSLQINCENFIMGCTLGFQTILNQTLAFATLDKNWVAHAHYLIVCPYDAKYRMQESKNKLELFYWLFIRFFLSCFFSPGLKNMFEQSLKLLLQILKSFECLSSTDWSGFCFFSGLLVPFLHMQ